jgi:hypothetical protein
MTLARQTTKPGLTSGKAFMWALMRGIALLLLFTHQSWASVICYCADESVWRHACCPTDSHSSCDAEATEMNSQPREAAMCRRLAPQAAEQTFPITTPIFISAEDHIQRSGPLMKKAAEYRAEAESHKKMLADYSKGVAKTPKDTGENPYVKKMRLHCEKYINAAETLAREADEMAWFHEMRAKEMDGK